MTKISHEDNFASNLSANVSAAVTTSTLTDTPSASAPFYLAFDATDVNGNYEVHRILTSPGLGVVTHAALANAHTTAEEVRMVCPGKELDLMYQVPEGTMLNGKITPTDAAGLTLTLQTLAGTAPSVTDPVYVMIGGTLRSITAALSVAKADATNWCNSGATELATKEIDYFAYLGYNATDGVVLGFSRIPSANIYSDFSATTTNEKYCAISTITTAAAGDDYVNIGRFAATLSAGAGYTWTVPTYTTKNLIQRPIFETRFLSWQPVYTASASMTYATVTTNEATYKLSGNNCFIQFGSRGTIGGTPDITIKISDPFESSKVGGGFEIGGGAAGFDTAVRGCVWYKSAGTIDFLKYDSSAWGAGATKDIKANFFYEI